jgi:hypothetical protein
MMPLRGVWEKLEGTCIRLRKPGVNAGVSSATFSVQESTSSPNYGPIYGSEDR